MDVGDSTHKLKVIQVITHLDLGGAEEVAISLAEALYQDVDFVFFAVLGIADNQIGRDFLQRLTRLGIPVYSGTTIGMKYGGALHAGWQLSRLARRLRPDLIHVHTEIPEMTYACATLFGLSAKVRLIRTIHNSSLWPAWARIGRWAEGRMAGAKAAAVSQAGLDGLWRFQTEQGRPLSPADDTEVIYNGVARGVPPSEDSGPGRATRPLGQPVQVLFAGRFEVQKGVDLLPEIVEYAGRDTTQAVYLHVAGSGSKARELQQWASRPDLKWEVGIHEPVPALARRLQDGHFDIVLMPSRFEGLALVAIEALLAGVPVVATRVPGLAEVFTPDYPLLAPSEDSRAIGRLLAQAINRLPDYQDLTWRSIPLLHERFSHRSMAEKYLELYSRTLAPAASP
ncbi:glycosyltransferase [Deinococcus koreensis]|uniref:Group 1 glycosyl transferase n=1 Tax=Deinococcus koreensis TaxID=2054903 RepID=A0A2K3UTB0_9DEIO|nr:glycosyltransferase [Deinococcus koreensis]PNY79784.1 group 1 glycosyl transferase [Deinococcus koreensis]